mgnify:CR=1 FL=1
MNHTEWLEKSREEFIKRINNLPTISSYGVLVGPIKEYAQIDSGALMHAEAIDLSVSDDTIVYHLRKGTPMKDYKMIVEYNLANFVFAIQEAFKEGYELSEEMDYYPVALGAGLYRAGVVKNNSSTPVGTEEAITTTPKAGRPKKV